MQALESRRKFEASSAASQSSKHGLLTSNYSVYLLARVQAFSGCLGDREILQQMLLRECNLIIAENIMRKHELPLVAGLAQTCHTVLI